MTGIGHSGGIGRAVDIVSAGLFGAACSYAVLTLSESQAGAAAAAAAGFVAALTALARIDGAPRFAIAGFTAAEFDDESGELLLTELTELLLTDAAPVEEELLLEDRLEQPGDNSRVIRLFDPRTLPTAEELHQRRERHVDARDRSAYPDATAELHRALADLRGALR